MSKLPETAPIPGNAAFQIEGESILVASPLSFPEACFSVSAVRALRHGCPEAALAILTPASIAPLWRTVSGVDQIIDYPDGASLKETAARLKESGFQPASAIVWDDSEAARALVKARVPQRIGYDTKPLGKRLTNRIAPATLAGPVEHRVRHYLGLIEPLGFECYVARNFETPPLPPRPSPIRIGLAPGSILGGAYRWDVERFRELGDALLASHAAELVIISYPGYANEANELERRFEGRVRNFGSEFDLPGLLGALPFLSFLVANDGAIMHLAAHLGIPVVALFGPGDPAAARPLGRQHIVLSQYVECSPCNERSCPLHHHRCLDELPVARVLEAVTALLEPQPAPAA